MIAMNRLTITELTIPSLSVSLIGNPSLRHEHHYEHYLLANGGHYITADNEYYQCRE